MPALYSTERCQGLGATVKLKLAGVCPVPATCLAGTASAHFTEEETEAQRGEVTCSGHIAGCGRGGIRSPNLPDLKPWRP